MRRTVPLLALALVACGKKEKEPLPLLVEVVRPTTESIADTSLALTGTVRAPFESDLGFRVAGTIVERRVNRGQTVRRGEVLARLDPADLENARRAADASSAAAVRDARAAAAQASQAAAEERRLRGLDSAGAVAPLTYERARDQARATAEQAASAAARARAAAAEAAQARDRADYTLLRAPSDGVVVDVIGEQGQVVQPGTPAIRFGRAGAREADVSLPETALGQARQPATATLYVGGPATPARLRELSAAADPTARTFRARYTLTGEAANAPIGSTVTVTLARADRPATTGAARTLTVPAGAIVNSGPGPHVFVVDRASSSVVSRRIRVVKVGTETAQVEGELRPQDLLVRQGGFLLKPGQKVRVTTGQGS